MISLAGLRSCVAAAVKKAAGRCFNTPVVNQEIRRLLKAMSSPGFDTVEMAHFDEPSTGQPARVPAGGAVGVSVSDNVNVGVNSDSPSADSETVANVKDVNDSVTISISGVTTEKTSDEKKPSTLSKRAARRVSEGLPTRDSRAIMCDTRGGRGSEGDRPVFDFRLISSNKAYKYSTYRVF